MIVMVLLCKQMIVMVLLCKQMIVMNFANEEFNIMKDYLIHTLLANQNSTFCNHESLKGIFFTNQHSSFHRNVS